MFDDSQKKHHSQEGDRVAFFGYRIEKFLPDLK